MPKSKRGSRREADDEDIATAFNKDRRHHPRATAGQRPSSSSVSPAAANASTTAMQKAQEVNPPTASTIAVLMRQQFLPKPGEPALKWPVPHIRRSSQWYRHGEYLRQTESGHNS